MFNKRMRKIEKSWPFFITLDITERFDIIKFFYTFGKVS